MVEVSLAAADALAAEGVEAEVIDLRSIVPMDVETIVASVMRTGRAIVVHEAVVPFGAGAEVAARITEETFGRLQAPVARIGAPPAPLAFSPPLEAASIPDSDAVAAAVRRTMAA
jgi:pyruvate dehydrogenase E1 component beta subunit